MKPAVILLRFGLAFTLIYAGISAFINPDAWVGFIPTFLKDFLVDEILLTAHSVGNIILGLWLLLGWKVYYSAFISAIAIASILVFNLGAMDIVFRDVGLLLAAVALVFLSKGREEVKV